MKIERIEDVLKRDDWVYGEFPEQVTGEFRRITIHPDENSKGTLEIDDPFFSSPSPAEREAFMKRHSEFPALTDYIELQAFMRYVSLPRIESGQKIQCWWTPSGWEEYGKPLFEQAEKLGLNPTLQIATTLENLSTIDNNQVIVSITERGTRIK